MSPPNDHTAFESSLGVAFAGAATVFLVCMSFAALGLALAETVLGVGILLVPALTVLAYYGLGGETAHLGYYADQYWRETYPEWYGDDTSEYANADSLETLRERYARGELTDEGFERKLGVLLDTETRESAAEWHRSNSTRIDERATETADRSN